MPAFNEFEHFPDPELLLRSEGSPRFQIERSRRARLSMVLSRLPLGEGGTVPLTLVVHVFPTPNGGFDPDLRSIFRDPALAEAARDRFGKTFDGIARWTSTGLLVADSARPISDPPAYYLSVARSGIAEYVDSRIVIDNRTRAFSAVAVERLVLKAVQGWAEGLHGLPAYTSGFVAVSLLGARGQRLRFERADDIAAHPIEDEHVLLPTGPMASLTTPVQALAAQLRETFHALWQAGGRPGSASFDKNGQYLPSM